MRVFRNVYQFVVCVCVCVCVCASFRFGFEDGMWDISVLVSEYCLSFYFLSPTERLVYIAMSLASMQPSIRSFVYIFMSPP